MLKYISIFFDFCRRIYRKVVVLPMGKCRLGYCGKNVNYQNSTSAPSRVLKRVHLYDNTTLNSTSIISGGGRFIMKKNSGSSSGLTVITGNHHRKLGVSFIDGRDNENLDIEKDIIVEEDVWIGAGVTLLSGITVGRGVTIGAGSVCLKSIPPYAVVMGNPAKVVGFNFTPEEIIEHEKALYPEEERLSIELLEKNYKKYFLDHIKEIKAYTGLICK